MKLHYTPREMLSKLVSFDTVSSQSNLALIDFIAEYLEAHQITSQRVFNEDKSKANLMATIGPNVAGGVILSGHTDVVPVVGQPWNTDPFNVVEADGKLYGRGTCDMKGFIAIALALVPQMQAKKMQYPIHLALSYDEEIGCAGAPPMVRKMAADLPQVRAVIVGEPTRMKVVSAHKGICTLHTQVTGHEAHSSQPHRGVSAVMTAAHLIDYINDMMTQNKMNPVDLPMQPPFTTLHVGKISGGTAINIISRQCEFEWDIRTVPTDEPMQFVERFRRYCDEEILPSMLKTSKQCAIDTRIDSLTPGLKPEHEGAAEALCHELVGENSTHMVAYAAEAGLFQQAGFSTVICGPGSIDQAHQPNEFLEVSQLEQGVEFVEKLIDCLCHEQGGPL